MKRIVLQPLNHSVPSSLPLRESQVVAALAPGRTVLKIGEVARRSGLPIKTIRFYSEEGLIHPVGRTEGGYRLFSEEVFAELTLIRTLKAMEIPLQDVRQILESRRSGLCTCASLRQTLHGKAGEIEQKIASLRDLHRELIDLLSRWQDCGGQKPSAV
jgi:MerR family transcriptional regulator, copper efflux regulator